MFLADTEIFFFESINKIITHSTGKSVTENLLETNRLLKSQSYPM